jgi:hypothetical protein
MGNITHIVTHIGLDVHKDTRSWPAQRETRSALARWIKAAYNRRRRHSSIGMLAPVVYEDRLRYSAIQPNNAVYQDGKSNGFELKPRGQ